MAWSKTTPATTTKVKDSPAIFQGNWAAIEDAFEQEHQDTSDTLPGAHLPGRCGVLFIGTTANIAALTTPPACAVSYNTSLSAFQYYTGSAWTTLYPDHQLMTGLTSGDPHIQYVELSGASQAITEDITFQGSITMTADETVDGVDISAHAATAASLGHTEGLGTLLGAWTAKSFDTVYQATTDGLVCGYIMTPTGYGGEMIAYSDSSNPPTTVRSRSVADNSGQYIRDANVTFPVLKNDYYKVTVTAYGIAMSYTGALYFISIGS